MFVFSRYSTFVNWEFWWPNFPILVYFKETQTKPEGQIHFFPIIFVSNLEASKANIQIGNSLEIKYILARVAGIKF